MKEEVPLRVYEGFFLVSNNEANKDLNAVMQHIRELLEKRKAKVLAIDKWDERKLAFEIGGMRRGTYILTYFTIPNEELQDLNRELRLSELIIRYLVIKDADAEEARHAMIPKPSMAPRIEPIGGRSDGPGAPETAGAGGGREGGRDGGHDGARERGRDRG